MKTQINKWYWYDDGLNFTKVQVYIGKLHPADSINMEDDEVAVKFGLGYAIVKEGNLKEISQEEME